MIPIFVVLYKMPEMEKKCIEDVRRYTDPKQGELVVIDNGAENRNLSRVWNEAISNYAGWASDADQLGALLNTDCFVTPNWLEKLERVMRLSDRIGFVGPMTNHCRGRQQAPPDYAPDAYAQQVVYDEMLSGFCLLFRKKMWAEAGGFPENSPFYGQESALIWKARRLGWRTAIAVDCWVEHLGSASARAAAERGELDYEAERAKGKAWFRAFTTGQADDKAKA